MPSAPEVPSYDMTHDDDEYEDPVVMSGDEYEPAAEDDAESEYEEDMIELRPCTTLLAKGNYRSGGSAGSSSRPREECRLTKVLADGIIGGFGCL